MYFHANFKQFYFLPFWHFSPWEKAFLLYREKCGKNRGFYHIGEKPANPANSRISGTDNLKLGFDNPRVVTATSGCFRHAVIKCLRCISASVFTTSAILLLISINMKHMLLSLFTRHNPSRIMYNVYSRRRDSNRINELSQ